MTVYSPTWGETDAPSLPLPCPDRGYSRRAAVRRAVYALRQHRAMVARWEALPCRAIVSRGHDALLLDDVRRAIKSRNQPCR